MNEVMLETGPGTSRASTWPRRETTGNRIREWLLVLSGASFLLQPLNVRVSGSIPVTFVLLIVLTLYGVVGYRITRQYRWLLFGGAWCALVLVTEILLGDGQVRRSAIVLFYLVFLCSVVGHSYRPVALHRAVETLAAVCTVLSVVAIYRYVYGYNVEGSANPFGMATGVPSYFYLGISYLPGTRNSDAFYFAVGALASLYLAKEKRVARMAYYAAFAVNCLTAVLSLSRGVWLGVAVALIMASSKRRYIGVGVCALVAVYYVADALSSSSNLAVNLVANGVVSLVSSSRAQDALAMSYTYSNVDRLEIYTSAFGDILGAPFGHGIGFAPAYSALTGTQTVHSENEFLDFLMIFGWPSVALIYQVFVKPLLSLGSIQGTRMPLFTLCFALHVLLVVFMMFNSLIDFALAWYVIALVLIAAQIGGPSGTRIPSIPAAFSVFRAPI